MIRPTILIGVIASALTTASGCAPTIVSVSEPPIQISINPHFHAQFEPLDQGQDSFVAFRLTVTNETTEPLEIDWNQTRYLFNGNPNGIFVFKDIDPEAVKSRTIAPDTIPPQGILTRTIAPQKLMIDAPLADHQKPGQSAFSGGPIPVGQSGIFLVVKQGDTNITETLTVDITRIEGTNE
jgi:hypothetical protein